MPDQIHQANDDDVIEVESLQAEGALPLWEPEGRQGTLTARCGQALEAPLAAYALGVLQDVQGHGAAEPGREVGGVLIGQFVQTRVGPLTRVDDIIIADSDQASLTHVTFTHSCWEQIHRELERREDATQIVGWYHTHPGFGPFLSGQDLFIQRNFFSHPLHTALVFDPVQNIFASFGWSQGEIVCAAGCYVWVSEAEVAELSAFLQSVRYGSANGGRR